MPGREGAFNKLTAEVFNFCFMECSTETRLKGILIWCMKLGSHLVNASPRKNVSSEVVGGERRN